MSVGVGYDSHRFDKTCPLILGGIEIPGSPGLLGHSDGDAVLHAIIDALLGAAALFQLADAMQVMAIGVLRGVQETRVPMIIATISYWLVGLPVAYTLGFPLGLGGVGVWLGLAAGLGLAAVLLMLWFWRRVYPRLRLSLPPEPVPPMPFPAT